MKRAPRTTLTWRFENPMAPHSKNYMPCPVLPADLVMVVVTLFRGQANLVAWFTSDTPEPILGYFKFSGREFRDKVGTGSVSGSRNGNAVRLEMGFDCEKGIDFTHTACEKFIAFVDVLGDPEYRKARYLPHPEISQVTMVEAYAHDNWVEYGECLWVTRYASRVDAAADATVR